MQYQMIVMDFNRLQETSKEVETLCRKMNDALNAGWQIERTDVIGTIIVYILNKPSA